MQDVQAVVLGEHRERVLEQPVAVVFEAGVLASAVGIAQGEQFAGLHRGDEDSAVPRAHGDAPGMTRSSPEAVFGRGYAMAL